MSTKELLSAMNHNCKVVDFLQLVPISWNHKINSLKFCYSKLKILNSIFQTVLFTTWSLFLLGRLTLNLFQPENSMNVQKYILHIYFLLLSSLIMFGNTFLILRHKTLVLVMNSIIHSDFRWQGK